MTWLVLAFHVRATLCEVAGGGMVGGGVGGGVGVVDTPSPVMVSDSGEVGLALRSVKVAEAGPATCGENQTWNVTFLFGESEKPGDKPENPKPAPEIVTPCTERLISPVFCSVTFCVLVDFKLRLPKLTTVGEMTRLAKAFSAMPARVTAGASGVAFEVTLSVPEALPAVVGANVKV